MILVVVALPFRNCSIQPVLYHFREEKSIIVNCVFQNVARKITCFKAAKLTVLLLWKIPIILTFVGSVFHNCLTSDS